MKKISLILGDLIPKDRQNDLLLSFQNEAEKQALNFEIDLYRENNIPTDIQYVITAFPPPRSLTIFKNLELVVSLNAGVEEILFQLQKTPDVKVARLVNPNAIERIGQYICHTVLEKVRLFPRWREQNKENLWDRSAPFYDELSTVGIMGLGNVGLTIASQLQSLGLHVIGFSRTKKTNIPFPTYTDLDKFLPKVNILVNALPLTDKTKRIIDEEMLHKLPQKASLINVGRGDHINENDLLASLNSGHLSSATLDVFCKEPLPENHPFWEHPNIFITPHISGIFNIKENILPALMACHYFNEKKYIEHEATIQKGY